jgi:Helix-loop-helix DNA-binding domain
MAVEASKFRKEDDSLEGPPSFTLAASAGMCENVEANLDDSAWAYFTTSSSETQPFVYHDPLDDLSRELHLSNGHAESNEGFRFLFEIPSLIPEQEVLGVQYGAEIGRSVERAQNDDPEHLKLRTQQEQGQTNMQKVDEQSASESSSVPLDKLVDASLNLTKEERALRRRVFHKVHTRRSRAKLNEKLDHLRLILPTPPPGTCVKSKAQILDWAIACANAGRFASQPLATLTTHRKQRQNVSARH